MTPIISKIFQADLDKAEGRDLNVQVTNWQKPPLDAPTWLVTCKRRNSPGQLQVTVQAYSAEQAKEFVQTGVVPGIGLGWMPIHISPKL